MVESREGYGIYVAKIEDVSGMKYINGKDTVTYFSGVFYRTREHPEDKIVF